MTYLFDPVSSSPMTSVRAHIKRDGAELLTTTIQRGATSGAGAVVICGVMIREHAFIGAGTVVTSDVPAHGFVVGNPGRLIGWGMHGGCGPICAAAAAEF
jgi:acetyltransferase-like isoleucine patch superfamily enzyme